MHVVRKESSTTTKIRAVFDASARSTTGVSLNDILLVGPTVHQPLIDVLLPFCLRHVGLVADVSKMYRVVELSKSDRDLYRFVWRQSLSEQLREYRMTHVTCGVSASSFSANMAVIQNATDLGLEFPLAFDAMIKSFYIDDALTRADSIELRKQLHDLFSRGRFFY